MKKVILMAAVVLMAGCGFLQNSTSSNASNQPAIAGTQTTQTGTAAMTAGQGAGNALLALYNQYKADGNKYDYKNLQNAANTITLIANCEGLKENYKDKTYLSEFGKGMVASSLGLVTQNNVQNITNSLVDMVKSSETVQNVSSTAQNTANTAASYASTAAQYAGALSTLLGAFSGQQ